MTPHYPAPLGRTVPAVAARCGVSPATVRRWIRAGDLQAVRVGQSYRVSDEALASFIGAGVQR